MIKVLHIITGLGSGGAENMLFKYLKHSDRNLFEHKVISLIDEGVYGQRIKDLGMIVHALNMPQGHGLRSFFQARKACKNVDIVSTWLYHADFFGFLLSRTFFRKKLVWNIRHSNLNKNLNKKKTLRIVKTNSVVSPLINGITFNSNKAVETHLAFGYKNKNIKMIHNGFELDALCYDEESRKSTRKQLNINADTTALITVGRWDAQKDYTTLFKALSEVMKKNSNFVMIMVGTNLDHNNNELCDLIESFKLGEHTLLLGKKDNIPALLSSADCYISSSAGESFSNAIGEAMACELPCIVTDVGDTRLMVGDTGEVIPPEDFERMAQSICSFLENPISGRNERARDRVVRLFNISTAASQFDDFFRSVYEQQRKRGEK